MIHIQQANIYLNYTKPYIRRFPRYKKKYALLKDGAFWADTHSGKFRVVGVVHDGVLYCKFRVFLRIESKIHGQCCQISNYVVGSGLKGICYRYQTEKGVWKRRYVSMKELMQNPIVQCGREGEPKRIIIMKQGKRLPYHIEHWELRRYVFN